MIDPKRHRRLLDAVQKRGEVDYRIEMEMPDVAAEEVIGWGEEFLRTDRGYLE